MSCERSSTYEYAHFHASHIKRALAAVRIYHKKWKICINIDSTFQYAPLFSNVIVNENKTKQKKIMEEMSFLIYSSRREYLHVISCHVIFPPCH